MFINIVTCNFYILSLHISIHCISCLFSYAVNALFLWFVLQFCAINHIKCVVTFTCQIVVFWSRSKHHHVAGSERFGSTAPRTSRGPVLLTWRQMLLQHRLPALYGHLPRHVRFCPLPVEADAVVSRAVGVQTSVTQKFTPHSTQSLTTTILSFNFSNRHKPPVLITVYSRTCVCNLNDSRLDHPVNTCHVLAATQGFGHQQRLLQTFTEDVFIFSLLMYIAHYSFPDDALYKFTYLLTYLLTYLSFRSMMKTVWRFVAVCLSVCLLATLRENSWTDLHENFTADVSVVTGCALGRTWLRPQRWTACCPPRR